MRILNPIKLVYKNTLKALAISQLFLLNTISADPFEQLKGRNEDVLAGGTTLLFYVHVFLGIAFGYGIYCGIIHQQWKILIRVVIGGILLTLSYNTIVTNITALIKAANYILS